MLSADQRKGEESVGNSNWKYFAHFLAASSSFLFRLCFSRPPRSSFLIPFLFPFVAEKYRGNANTAKMPPSVSEIRKIGFPLGENCTRSAARSKSFGQNISASAVAKI